jgi:DNA polymerase I-like protein with 3'-5' exonuclease and polymerase domains
VRADAMGLLWQDVPKVSRTQRPQNRPRPAIPDTGWHTPELPNLAHYSGPLGIDLETRDDNLFTTGPSTRTGGYIVGVSVATDDRAWYLPVRHLDGLGENLCEQSVRRWLRDVLATNGNPKIFANALYDMEWLRWWGVPVEGAIHDVQFAEPLLDENARTYSLESLGQKYIGEGKDDTPLYEWLAMAYGGQPTRRAQGGNIYRAPTALVGPYAEQDAMLPVRIWYKQRSILQEMDLATLYDLECRLIPPLLDMRELGVRVDVERAEALYADLRGRVGRLAPDVDIWAANSIAAMCDKAGIAYPRTDAGNPSFQQSWLVAHPDQRIQAIAEARKYDKAAETFVKGYILDKHIDGRIHGQFHPLRTDENGTVSGRFASSNPNLQNIPARDPELGPLIRSLFLPEVGMQWGRADYSQIEFRLLCHYGRGTGADVAREQFSEDPRTDFHQMVSELTGLDRKPAKNINFGLVYGMGEQTMARNMGVDIHEAQELFDEYHTRLPFVKSTYNQAARAARSKGYVRTMMGRRRNFHLFQPEEWGKNYKALPLKEAMAKWPGKRLQPAYTHKALNAVLQGSAADLMKLAMVQAYEEGVFKETPLHLTVHDELDVSFTDPAQLEPLREAMEGCVNLKVETGPNWGECK